MEKVFKSVILFNCQRERSTDLKNSLSGPGTIKVFQTKNLDEVCQIVEMSNRTAILIDSYSIAETLGSVNLEVKNNLYRRYLLDWELSISKPARIQLNSKGITTISFKELTPVIEKMEIYLFGKVNIFNKKDFVEPKGQSEQIGKAFFTLIDLSHDQGRVLLSSHERENNISEVLGKNWDTFLLETLESAGSFTLPVEEILDNQQFYQIIFPHTKSNPRKISIVHVLCDEKLPENLLRVKAFLASI